MGDNDEYENESFDRRNTMFGGSLKTNEEDFKSESFISYMFVLTQKDKMELMNVFQYIILAIIQK